LGAVADLQRLIDERVCENVHLEFKQKADRTKPAFSGKDDWHFSRALAGFANSDGGILVWGVKSEKPNDCPVELMAIRGYEEFLGRLKKSLIDSVQPSVDGVRIEGIPAGQTDFGYVKCLIPASSKTPHRAMLADREYYKRSTEGFYRLEHFDLEDLFGRRPVPVLRVTLDRRADGLQTEGPGTTIYTGRVVVALRNEGRGSARSPYLVVTIDGQAYRFETVGQHLTVNGLPIRTSTDRRRVFSSGDVVIHPEFTHDCTSVLVSTQVGHRMAVVVPQDLKLLVEASAENARPVRSEYVISGREIAEFVLPENLREFIPGRA
jgi:hypothetical protein